MSIAQVDHIKNGISLLISQYQNKPRIAAWLTAYLKQFNEIEQMFQDILTKFDVDVAVGDQLDLVGKIVGQERAGASDDEYRLYIKVRILINKSKGRGDDVEAVAAAALGAATFQLIEYFPASFVIDAIDAVPAHADLVASFINQARGAGIGASFQYVTTSMSVFQFADAGVNVQQFAPTTGWGDTAASVGGHLMAVY